MSTMRAIRAHARGGPEQLACEQAPRPRPRPGEALVAVAAASITPGELTWESTWTDAAGRDRTPVIPAHEMSGIVEEIAGAARVAPGDSVYALVPFDRDGAAADYITVPASLLAPKPARLSHAEAAALALPGLTAWQALVTSAGLTCGQRVLVHGAAGGVGSVTVQLAVALGAEVSATCSAADQEFVVGLGAATVIDYAADKFEDQVHDLDVVIDTVGGDTLARSAAVLRPGGILVGVADAPDAEEAARHGVRTAYFIVSADPDQLTRIARLADTGQLRPVIGATYPLEQTAAAYAGLDHDHRRGKVVLDLRRRS